MKAFKSLKQLERLHNPQPRVIHGTMTYGQKGTAHHVDCNLEMSIDDAPTGRFEPFLSVGQDGKWKVDFRSPQNGRGNKFVKQATAVDRCRLQGLIAQPPTTLDFFSCAKIDMTINPNGTLCVVLPDDRPPYKPRIHYAEQQKKITQIQKHLDAITAIRTANPDLVVRIGEVDEGDGELEVWVALRESKRGDLL